jgi:hypothetical protein
MQGGRAVSLRPALAVLVLAALAAPALGSPAPPQVSFHVPAQAGGALAVGSAQWALVLVHSGSVGVGLGLPQGGAVTTRTVASADTDSGHLQPAPNGRPDLSSALAPGEASLAFPANGWGSFVIAADRIDATLSGGGSLGGVAAGEPLDPLLWSAAPPAGTLPPFPHLAAAGSAMVLQDGPGGQLHLTVTGLRRVEWYNATVRCSMECPDGPAYQSWAAPTPIPTRVELRNYTALDADGGEATVDGVADALVLGGGALDVTVDGWARLPEVALEGCGACGSGRTLRLDGDALAFRGLSPDAREPGRLQGRLEAASALAALDEDAGVPLAAAVGVGVAAGGGLLVAALAGLRALGLLRFRAPEEPGFGHRRRTGLFELVAGEPGLTFREVERRLGWGNGVTRHHLDVLVSEGHLVARRHLNTVRYFENHGRFDHDWQAVVHRRDPDSRWLLDVLQEAPRTQGEVVALAAAQGRSRSATQRKLARLVADGLVAARPDGNGRRYSVIPPPAPEPFRWLGRRAPAPVTAAPGVPARPGGTAGP